MLKKLIDIKMTCLSVFHARKVDTNKTDEYQASSSQYYTTSSTGTTYELEGYAKNGLSFAQESSSDNKDENSRVSPTIRGSSDAHTRAKSMSFEREQTQEPIFFTEVSTSTDEKIDIPFHEAFQLSPDLVDSLMLK